MRLAPDLSRTLLAIGDVHQYAVTTPAPKTGANSRAAQVQQRTLAMGDPAGVLQVGDLAEVGTSDEAGVVGPWWAAWPSPKIVCTGNHDVGGGGDTVAGWEARYGDRTQVLDTEHYRVVSCLWSSQADGTGTLARALNTPDGWAELDSLIAASTKPTALAFHYALRGSVPSTELPAGDYAITAYAQDTVLANLIAANDNLQLVITGHTHTAPSACVNWGVTGKPTGTNGRRVHHHNVAATTYVGALSNATVRSPLNVFYFSFYDDHFEARIRDIEGDLWIPRWFGMPKVERYDYS